MFLKNKKASKVFCIGFGKTGTTSLEKALKDYGYRLGDQPKGELLIHDWAKRNFKTIIKFCETADAFQDTPFCLPFTYIALDEAFPGSKFILSVRSSSEQWYDSLIRFHSKIYAEGKRIPNAEDYKNSDYRYKGYSWESRLLIYNINNNNPNDKEILINSYEGHNASVKEYFRHRSEDLLILNVANEDSYQQLCKFLNKKPLYDKFPWLNKT